MTNLHNAPGLSQDLDDYRKFEQNERFNDMFDDGDLGDYALMLRRPDGTETPSFQHGAAIECVLNIHRKLDEVGDVHITGYTVATVLSKSDGGVAYETPQCKRHRFAKKQSAGQGKLFGLPE